MRRYIIGLASLVLAAASVGTVGTGPARADLDCGFDFVPSTPGVYPPRILGQALAGCDVPPDEHIVTLALETQEGGRWVVQSVTTDRTIPPPYKLGGHHYEVSAACYSGTWRVAVGIEGKIQGHDFHYNNASNSVVVPTSKCHPRA